MVDALSGVWCGLALLGGVASTVDVLSRMWLGLTLVGDIASADMGDDRVVGESASPTVGNFCEIIPSAMQASLLRK